MDIIEGNKCIAEFHGLVLDEHSFIVHNPTKIKIGKDHDLQYHSSWDWLMPVVEKIYFDDLTSTKQWSIIAESFRRPNIETTWKSVIQFIQWYKAKVSDTTKAK